MGTYTEIPGTIEYQAPPHMDDGRIDPQYYAESYTYWRDYNDAYFAALARRRLRMIVLGSLIIIGFVMMTASSLVLAYMIVRTL